MNAALSYRLSLLGESINLSGEMLLIKLHLKTVTIEERQVLKRRAEKLHALIADQEK